MAWPGHEWRYRLMVLIRVMRVCSNLKRVMITEIILLQPHLHFGSGGCAPECNWRMPRRISCRFQYIYGTCRSSGMSIRKNIYQLISQLCRNIAMPSVILRSPIPIIQRAEKISFQTFLGNDIEVVSFITSSDFYVFLFVSVRNRIYHRGITHGSCRAYSLGVYASFPSGCRSSETRERKKKSFHVFQVTYTSII